MKPIRPNPNAGGIGGELFVDDHGSLVGERKPWLLRIVVVLALLCFIGLLVHGASRLMRDADGPKRQTTRIAILPDTPPPPPPPPPKEDPKREPPKEAPAKQMPPDTPKPAPTPPANEPIKMEGPAGDGPSAYAAGPVTREATGGGTIGGASSPGGVAGTGSDRARERFYANTVRQLLRDELERQLKPEAGELSANFALWVEPDGRIKRAELLPDASTRGEAEMQAALGGTVRTLRLPPPEGLAQPLRFRLTVRSQG